MAAHELRQNPEHDPEQRRTPDWRQEPKSELERKLGALRVLIVDDSAFVRKMIRSLLIGIGVHAMTEAADGFAGLQALASFQPDVILLDLEMPNLNGLQFVRRLRERSDFAKLAGRILFLSAHADRERVLFARDNGIGGFVAKPISTNVLRGHIVSILKKTQAPEKLDALRHAKETFKKQLPKAELPAEPLPAERSPAEEPESVILID